MADTDATGTETDAAAPLVLVERRDDGVAIVTLNNPKVNALSGAVLARLEQVARKLTEDPPGAVVITGGERLFAAGADVSEFGGGDRAREVADNFRRALDSVAGIPRTVIAAISGFALGGGCELALACDLRLASTKAKLGQPEILLGIIPGGGGTQRLPRLVGSSRAKDLILTGRQVGAEEALKMGLVDRVVPHDELHAQAIELAGNLARGPVAAHASAKRAIDRGLDMGLAEGLALERELFADVADTEDARIGVASFLEHGPGRASFEGR